MAKRAIVVTAGGEVFCGEAFGASTTVIGELAFDTGVVGYQEVLTDPYYNDKALVMTFPLAGCCGVTGEDDQSESGHPRALIVREFARRPSNFRSVMSLSELLEEREITGVYGVDTREMTHYIRKHGSCRALITSEDMSPEEARALLAKSETQSDEVARASCDRRWYSRTASHSNTIAVLDCGVKQSLINALGSFGCNVTVMPHDTSAAEILACAPDGLVISNGPGDPKKAVSALETVKALKGKLPMFGTGLGLLLIALACGADTAKLPFGMHGGCPARDAVSGRIFSASCALSYAPVASTLTSAGLVQTYSSIPGGLVFGVQSESQRLYGVLFDSEGAPGSRDACALLCSFVNSLQGRA